MNKLYVFSLKPSCIQYPAYVAINPIESITTKTKATDYALATYGKAVDKVFAMNDLNLMKETKVLPFGSKIDFQDIDPDTGKVIETISYYPGFKWLLKDNNDEIGK